jgi:hypothetical protein
MVLTAEGNRLQLALPRIILDFTFEADRAMEHIGGGTTAYNLDSAFAPGTSNRDISVCHCLPSMLIL